MPDLISEGPSPRSAPIVVTVREAAGILCCSERKMRQLVADGEIPSLKIGRLVRIPYVALVDFVADRLRNRPQDEAHSVA